MEWPVLGKRKTPTETRVEIAPKKTKILKQQHQNLKFDTLFRAKTLLPEVEDLIMEFATPKQYKLFQQKYGNTAAKYEGEQFVAGSNWGVPSTTMKQYTWVMFNVLTCKLPCSIFECPGVVARCNENLMTPLVGKEVLVIYKNRRNDITMMDPKTVVSVHSNTMVLRACHSTDVANSFTISYSGILKIRLFIYMKIERHPLSQYAQ